MPSDIIDSKLLFECTQCGECCKGYGGTYVTHNDIERISRHIDGDPAKFVQQFCNLSGKRPVLAQREDKYCIFWDQFCTIHPVKPLMCRKWPFLESILVDPANWLIMSKSCPGIHTEVDPNVLIRFVRLMVSSNWNSHP